jgi:hypothetical protein
MNIIYKDIMISINPWSKGSGEYQELLGMKNEPKLIVYTPDIEFYCETIEQAKKGIDNWILKHGSYEFYEAKQRKIIGF